MYTFNSCTQGSTQHCVRLPHFRLEVRFNVALQFCKVFTRTHIQNFGRAQELNKDDRKKSHFQDFEKTPDYINTRNLEVSKDRNTAVHEILVVEPGSIQKPIALPGLEQRSKFLAHDCVFS